MVNCLGYEDHRAIAKHELCAAGMQTAKALAASFGIAIPGKNGLVQPRPTVTGDDKYPTRCPTMRISHSDPRAGPAQESITFTYGKCTARAIEYIPEPDTAVAEEDSGVDSECSGVPHCDRHYPCNC